MEKEDSMEKADIKKWLGSIPQFSDVISTQEVFWMNPHYKKIILSNKDMLEAEARLRRFAPYIVSTFPETKPLNGIIESPLNEIKNMQKHLEKTYKVNLPGRMFLKCDSHLPISGSIKARGGIYEVLKHAEEIAIQQNLLQENDDYAILNSESFRSLFSKYSISVGSTGNLGLSIGIISRMLGFQVTVHMSADAKQWKKDKLRGLGAIVKEYNDDYSKAVEMGRQEAATDPTCHFIDDEDSADLFFGYSTAATRLKRQLEESGIKVDEQHPLFVYLPCGVGGGPGGITYGLKLVFGENVHCFFAEPTHSPCMLLGLMTGEYNRISVQDVGIDNKTEADGLAVGRPSKFVSEKMNAILSGSYTIQDDRLFSLLKTMAETENYYLEPSALAGAYGPVQLLKTNDGKTYLKAHHLIEQMAQATHVIWATGGSMVPKEVMQQYVDHLNNKK